MVPDPNLRALMHSRVGKKRQTTTEDKTSMYVVLKYLPNEVPAINMVLLRALFEKGPLPYEEIAAQVKQSRELHGRTVTRDQIRQVLQYLRKLKITRVDDSHRWQLILPSPHVDLTDLTTAS